jgi:hypothetical protein
MVNYGELIKNTTLNPSVYEKSKKGTCYKKPIKPELISSNYYSSG